MVYSDFFTVPVMNLGTASLSFRVGDLGGT